MEFSFAYYFLDRTRNSRTGGARRNVEFRSFKQATLNAFLAHPTTPNRTDVTCTHSSNQNTGFSFEPTNNSEASLIRKRSVRFGTISVCHIYVVVEYMENKSNRAKQVMIRRSCWTRKIITLTSSHLTWASADIFVRKAGKEQRDLKNK